MDTILFPSSHDFAMAIGKLNALTLYTFVEWLHVSKNLISHIVSSLYIYISLNDLHMFEVYRPCQTDITTPSCNPSATCQRKVTPE